MSARRRAGAGGGGASCGCSNISMMQLFHELKQQFPAVADDAVTACVAAHCHDRPACRARLRREAALVPRALAYPMHVTAPPPAMTDTPHSASAPAQCTAKPPPCRRPPAKCPPNRANGSLDANTSKKPPDPPPKAASAPSSPTAARCPRPTTLDLPQPPLAPATPGVNVSVNVNCSVDVVPSPGGARRHSTVLQVTPEPAWRSSTSSPTLSSGSPRSYTSVNLTLRTPTSEPQPPIDICSANSSLTYTTSSFDSRQGLQSRLQITVGPGGVGSVAAVRTRPRSSYHPDTEHAADEPARAGSLPDLAAADTEAAPSAATTNHVVLVSRQLERKEQLRNELQSGRERLSAISREVQALQLENTIEIRTRLKRDIRHLQAQCERLTREVDRHSESRVPLGETNAEFYRHIYTGQRGSLHARFSAVSQGSTPASGAAPAAPAAAAEPDNEPFWSCPICTFRNHPLMSKCEQCEMPRFLLVSAGPGENIHIRFSPGNSTRVIHSWVV